MKESILFSFKLHNMCDIRDYKQFILDLHVLLINFVPGLACKTSILVLGLSITAQPKKDLVNCLHATCATATIVAAQIKNEFLSHNV